MDTFSIWGYRVSIYESCCISRPLWGLVITELYHLEVIMSRAMEVAPS